MFILLVHYYVAMSIVSTTEGDEPISASIFHHIDQRKCLGELNLEMWKWTD